jgi:hypothetical protein
MDEQDKINFIVLVENILEDLDNIKDRLTKLEKNNE